MTTINIERLKPATIVFRKGGDFGPFGDFAEVQSVEFDGHGYMVTARFLEGADDHVGETEIQFYVDAGETVEFGGRGVPVLRNPNDVTLDEHLAKIEADNAAIEALLAEQNRRAQCFGAVARALGVPALMAAE